MAKPERRPRDAFARDGGFRGLRLEGLLCRELNSLLADEISDPRLEGVRVTRVELTRDGSSARVWFAVPNPNRAVSPDAVTAAFERAAGFIRLRLSDTLPLKRSPELRFKHDLAALLRADIDENP